MKSLFYFFMLCFFLVNVTQPAHAGFVSQSPAPAKTEKTVGSHPKVMQHLQKTVEKAQTFIGKSPLHTKELTRYLRLAIIFAIVALAASIVVAIVPGGGYLWFIPSIAWLLSLIFLILWLVQEVAAV